MKQLILGGVRSGKSQIAEQQALDSGLEVVYIATATANDDEMRKRIQKHQQQRPTHWRLIEAPITLAESLQRHAAADRCLLVDCLTLWLTNLLMIEDPMVLERERKALLGALPRLPGQVILVSNETNMGVIPQGELSRRFCDQSGLMHQELARVCDRVFLTVAGLPHVLKGDPV